MAAPVDAPSGLVRAFAEFSLLPDLLALKRRWGNPPRAWTELLRRKGFNTDHVEDDELPAGSSLPAIMAKDAWRAAKWLKLVGPFGLTDAGRDVARVAELDSLARTEIEWAMAGKTIAGQIREHYLGKSGAPIVDLVEAGARQIKRAPDAWIRHCPGLLQIEFEALVHLAHTDPRRAKDLTAELANIRIRAMESVGPPLPGVVDLVNRLIHADTVTEYYLNELSAYVDDSVLTPTAAQATIIFFVFCGLLENPAPELPIQFFLAPHD